jgi:histidinol-phosphate aminotransferase
MNDRLLQHIPSHIRSLVPYVPGKPISETKREYGLKRVIKLASNENPLGPSPKALKVIRSAEKEIFRYPDASAFALKAALSKHHGLKSDHFLIGNGSDEVIELLIKSFCVAGDAIVTSQAAFVAYRIRAQTVGVRTLESPLGKEMIFDVERMLELIKSDERVKMVFIANPNNPTGTYIPDRDLQFFLQEVKKINANKSSQSSLRNITVVLDYAYWEFRTALDLSNPFDLFKKYSNVIILKTFSKIYGLAGLRVGYAIGRPELVSWGERIRTPFNLNSLGMEAAVAALTDLAFVKKSQLLNIKEMKVWEKELKRLSIPFLKSQGNFLLLETQEGFGKTGALVFEEGLKLGVIFRPVTNYGLRTWLRVSVGLPEENTIAIRALEKIKGK